MRYKIYSDNGNDDKDTRLLLVKGIYPQARDDKSQPWCGYN